MTICELPGNLADLDIRILEQAPDLIFFAQHIPLSNVGLILHSWIRFRWPHRDD